ncbi:dihydrofolate reductase [Sulfurimicrobium lacus]|uniref:Dihydrofolate reductase n=1 Tax=Sulfurimicrobium lacus TaxID=2715678 RepID=A0A6F8VDV0_9PROT|nr:dihydrofolate reductase [Sulfurimicrobium lacus]BCB27132.1 dihydrofolate reductase [Sulfurimicrobium lacus]
MKPRLSIIAAIDRNRVIGVDNKLPWRLPADLAHFKALTMGHHMVMGRKTYESLPGGKPLPGRISVIVTRDAAFSAPGCVVVHSLEEAVAACAGDDEAFFIGGADMYRQALDVAQRIYLTEVKTAVAGDAWFPDFDRSVWREVSRTNCLADEKNPHDYDFVVFDRVTSD